MGDVCRKNDGGSTTPDSGTPKPPDAGPGPAPDGPKPPPGNDTKPPQVAITSPAANAEVPTTTKVVVLATDDVGVVRVELSVDGALVASRDALPYEFTISLQMGAHLLAAAAFDKAGNKGQATVSVTAKSGAPGPGPGPGPAPGPSPDAGGAPGLFGSPCRLGTDCASKLCIEDPVVKGKYCSQRCGLQTSCPADSDCMQASDASWLCALRSQSTLPGQDATGAGGTGGCSHAGPAMPSLLSLLSLAILGALHLGRRRRR